MSSVRFNPGILCGALAFLPWIGAWSERDAAPREAVVLLSREAEPFRKCERAAVESLKKEGWSVSTAVLDEKGGAPGAENAAAILAVGTEAATWAKTKCSDSTNVVFCMVADAVGAGLPGKPSIAGVLSEVPPASQAALICETLPSARTVGVLYKKGSARGERWLAAIRTAAKERGLNVEAESVESKEEFEASLTALFKRDIDVLWTMPDGGLYDANTIKAALHASLAAKVPLFGFSTPLVRAGALVGLGIAPESQGEQASALLIERASQKGPLGSRLEDPKFEISVNQVVAERLGTTIPESVLGKAVNKFKGD